MCIGNKQNYLKIVLECLVWLREEMIFLFDFLFYTVLTQIKISYL